MRHEYYVCPYRARWRAGGAVGWRPDEKESAHDLNGEFWGRVFEAFEQHLESDQRLTVFMTWDLYELPRYGNDVVAVVFGDESGAPPRYAHRVGAVFKTHGVVPRPERPFSEVSVLAFWSHVRSARDAARLGVESIRRGTPFDGRNIPNMFEVPVGYGNQRQKEVRALRDRTHDVYFAGSVQNHVYSWWSPKRYASPPKEIARRAMFDAVSRFSEDHPEYVVDIGATSDFRASTSGDPEQYSKSLMNARICLAPRGTTVETYRLFEGLRYGCVVLSDPLPNRWYLDGLPVVEVPDWRRAGDILLDLLRDGDRMAFLHGEALRAWEERLNEDRIGEFVAKSVGRCPGR